MAKNLTWPAVVLVGVLGGLALGLLTLTDLTSGAVIGIVGVLAGVGGGAAVASAPSATAARVEETHAETVQQTETLNTIARRVNGELDARIAAAVEEGNGKVVAEMMAALRDEGVIGRG